MPSKPIQKFCSSPTTGDPAGPNPAQAFPLVPPTPGDVATGAAAAMDAPAQ